MKFNIIIIGMLFTALLTKGQDTITTEMLLPFTQSFTVENGVFDGEGRNLIHDLLDKNQFFMIGEYHGSQRISQFTNAVIKAGAPRGFNHLVMEVGPKTADYISNHILSKNVALNLKKHHQEYLYGEDDLSFPFFDYLSDATFLQSASDLDYKLMGIDQEYSLSIELWVDQLYKNLIDEQQTEQYDLYSRTKDSLEHWYKLDQQDSVDLSYSLTHSALFQTYLNQMNNNDENSAIVAALRASISIYYKNATRRWYWSNSDRISYMKKIFGEQVRKQNIDISKEKMIVKMGAIHLSRGISFLTFPEMGSMLGGLADFYGNQSVNVTFLNRYYMENDTIKDALTEYPKDEENVITALGDKETWSIIHLQPLIEFSQYYPLKFRLPEAIKKLALRYDYVVLVPTEYKPTANF